MTADHRLQAPDDHVEQRLSFSFCITAGRGRDERTRSVCRLHGKGGTKTQDLSRLSWEHLCIRDKASAVSHGRRPTTDREPLSDETSPIIRLCRVELASGVGEAG